MRVRRKPWATEELAQNPRVIQDPAAHRGHWQEVFDVKAPLYLEIGCGKGRFLIQTAQKEPDKNFLGMERDETVAATAARHLPEGVTNLRLLHANAMNVTDYFAPGEISRIYLNFSDPWPKKKWEKRRLTYRDFLVQYAQLLTPDGANFFKTDNPILFESSLNEFCAMDWRLSAITFDLHHSPWNEENIQTEYEEKFSAKGQKIFRLEARKR